MGYPMVEVFPMTSLNISLPEPMKAFIEQEVQSGRFSTPSEFVRALVREKQEARLQKELEAKLLEGLRSGKAGEMTAKDWATIRSRALGDVGRKGRGAREGKGRKAPAGRR